MAEKRGIQQTEEALMSVLATARTIAQIRREGVSGLPKLMALFESVKTGIEGGDQIVLEVKDLDMAEFMRLGKVGVIGTADILNEFGAKNLSPYVRVASNSLDAAEKTVALWAPIYDDVKAIRSDAQ